MDINVKLKDIIPNDLIKQAIYYANNAPNTYGLITIKESERKLKETIESHRELIKIWREVNNQQKIYQDFCDMSGIEWRQ